MGQQDGRALIGARPENTRSVSQLLSYEARNQDDHDGTDRGCDNLIDDGMPQIDVQLGHVQEPSTDHTADDAGNDVSEETPRAADDEAGEPARDGTNDKHDNDCSSVHVLDLPVCAAQRAGGPSERSYANLHSQF